MKQLWIFFAIRTVSLKGLFTNFLAKFLSKYTFFFLVIKIYIYITYQYASKAYHMYKAINDLEEGRLDTYVDETCVQSLVIDT